MDRREWLKGAGAAAALPMMLAAAAEAQSGERVVRRRVAPWTMRRSMS